MKVDTLSQKRNKITKNSTESKPKIKPVPADDVVNFLTEYGKENPETRVLIETNLGDITVELSEETHLYRASFIYLVKNKYFDDTYFHRSIPGFIIQGGNSDNRSTQKLRYRTGNYMLPPQYAESPPHAVGTLSAAKQWEGNPQDLHIPYEFFIIITPADHLNGEHTVFGIVIDGMDVVRKINALEIDSREWPHQNVYIDMKVID